MGAEGKRGLLLVNLGTPDGPTPPEVRRYLREFLSDPRVIDLSPVGRWLLLNLIILPFRPKQSAHAYQSIWTAAGSPLMVHSRALEAAVRARLGGEYEVELAMRYGNPSIPAALERLKARGVSSLTVLPLYPQDAASTTGSTLARLYEVAAGSWDVLPLRALESFYAHPAFLSAWAKVARPHIGAGDHVLFSFHGLPRRHLEKSDPSGSHCQMDDRCCAAIGPANQGCYRAQCFATARLISRALELAPERYTVSFQSRLGRAEWIRPYTDEVLPELARSHKRLAVICAAFVADCLETLEELGIRGKETFLAAGGESFTVVPCLNSDEAWVDAVVELVRGG